jgi:hypothetical protein
MEFLPLVPQLAEVSLPPEGPDAQNLLKSRELVKDVFEIVALNAVDHQFAALVLLSVN